MSSKITYQKRNELLHEKIKDIWKDWLDSEAKLFNAVISANKQLLKPIPGSNGLLVLVIAHPRSDQVSLIEDVTDTDWFYDHDDQLQNFPLPFFWQALAIKGQRKHFFYIKKSIDVCSNYVHLEDCLAFKVYIRYMLMALYSHDVSEQDGWSVWFSFNKKRIKNFPEHDKIKEFRRFLNQQSIAKIIELK